MWLKKDLSTLRRIRTSLAFRLLGQDGIAALVQSDGPSLRAVRARVAAEIDKRLGSTVAYGPFRGLKLAPAKGWNSLDRAGLLLAIYERELLEHLAAACSVPRPFVNVGAADGYYVVGALWAGWCDRAVAFETSPDRRALIAETAALNGVSDRLTILGQAGDDMVDAASQSLEGGGGAVWLIDVEGAEFSLLNDFVLGKLRDATLVVEVHRWADPSGEARERLWTRARAFDRVAFGTGARDPFCFEELADCSDDERWLVCSERRRMPGLWWQLTGPAAPHHRPIDGVGVDALTR
ncbi:hypothetical protein M1105_07710 [Limibaculum sp. FT325]|uniref:hypothetical protein n=1 Tax=Thermohalobaculum sediminis TaxID=2939436 RepID=UPI0020C10EB4|nr:hypothetical protein [Limibaculum sediminis]MCL5776868.1 hypothetical protein [Limibaculum sediminis]